MKIIFILFFSIILLFNIKIAIAVGDKPIIKKIELENVDAPVHFNSSGSLFVSTDRDSKSAIMRLNDKGGLVKLSSLEYRAKDENIKGLTADFSLDDQSLITTSPDKLLRWFMLKGYLHPGGNKVINNWDTIQYEKLIRFAHINSTGDYVVTGSEDGGLSVRKLQRNNQFGACAYLPSSEDVNSAGFSKDGKYIIASSLGSDASAVKFYSFSRPRLLEIDKIKHDDVVLQLILVRVGNLLLRDPLMDQ